MTDISFSNFFGTSNDFENLKKWFRLNSELYKELIMATKERCELESEYSSRLTKINAKLIKIFNQSLGSVSILWSKTANLMNEESEAHKTLGSKICEDVYKRLIETSDQFIKLKKPIENDIDKCIKSYQEKRDEESRLKKKAFLATKESEKSFENVTEYKSTHPSSVSGNDKERSKMERRAAQLLDCSSKAESEYIDSSMTAEDGRDKWEHSYISGLEDLQKIETDRLNSMKSIIEAYHKCLSDIPATYTDISSRLLWEINSVNIRDDLFQNAMQYTSKSPNIYKTEQLLCEFYAETKENKMDLNRRKNNLMKLINVLYEHQKKCDNLRTGTLKMLTVYEQSPEFADDPTRKKAKQEYTRIQCTMNILCANLYKVQVALHSFDNKPEPNNPLTSAGMKILCVLDRNSLNQSVLESKPGSKLSLYEPGVMSRSNSNNSFATKDSSSCYYEDEDDDFISDSETEPPMPPRAVVSPTSNSNSNSSSHGRFSLPGGVLQPNRPPTLNKPSFPNRQPIAAVRPAARPLPLLPNEIRCQALHDFNGRDDQELSFNEGDIIVVRNKLSNVWWEGQLRGKSGLVPTNYVKELQ